MPLVLPVLDDRTYADLVREGVELIPRWAPEWTNHNASDPGITLLELFAYLSEIYLYRVDRVSDADKAQFLELLLGHPASLAPGEPVDHLLREVVVHMRQPYRAVSPRDFETLALEASRSAIDAAPVVRVHCFGRRDLAASTEAERQRDRPGHVSLVFVPADSRLPEGGIEAIAQRIASYLEPRRLVTSRVHVVGPRYVDARIRVRISTAAGYARADVEQRVRTDLEQFFDPRDGGSDRDGWALGRSVYAFDIYRRLSPLEGVSRVAAVEFDVKESGKLRRDEAGGTLGVHLADGELLRVAALDVRADPETGTI